MIPTHVTDHREDRLVFEMADSTGAATVSAPASDRILKGDPQWRSWVSLCEQGNLAGKWESTPGAWTSNYDKWEFFTVLTGSGEITPLDGEPITLTPGTTVTIRPGFRGTWEIFETMTKYFFIRRA